MFAHEISYFMAFSAGLLSFFSPCVLPLLPAYISYITGMSIEDYSGELGAKAKKRMVLNTVSFILGFSFIFIVVFGAGTSLVGSAFSRHKELIGKVGGGVIFLFGLHFLRVLKFRWMYREKRAHFKRLPAGYLGSFLVGVAFSAGWTPCVGPILASIIGLGLTAENQWVAIRLLSLYTLGLALPFLLCSFAINVFLPFFNRAKRHFRFIEITTGVLLIVAGALMFTGEFEQVSGMVTKYWPSGN